MNGLAPLDLAAAFGVPAAGTVIAWAAGLAIAPGVLASVPFLLGSLRRREAWWLMSPAHSERRVDPRCDRRAWRRVAGYALPLFAPGAVLGLMFGWTVIGLMVAAAALTSVAVAAAVSQDSEALARFAWVPAWYGASLPVGAAIAGGAYVITHGLSPAVAAWALAGAPWLIAQAVAGWQILVAHRAQDGARRIARAALSDARELWLT